MYWGIGPGSVQFPASLHSSKEFLAALCRRAVSRRFIGFPRAHHDKQRRKIERRDDPDLPAAGQQRSSRRSRAVPASLTRRAKPERATRASSNATRSSEADRTRLAAASTPSERAARLRAFAIEAKRAQKGPEGQHKEWRQSPLVSRDIFEPDPRPGAITRSDNATKRIDRTTPRQSGFAVSKSEERSEVSQEQRQQQRGKPQTGQQRSPLAEQERINERP